MLTPPVFMSSCEVEKNRSLTVLRDASASKKALDKLKLEMLAAANSGRLVKAGVSNRNLPHMELGFPPLEENGVT